MPVPGSEDERRRERLFGSATVRFVGMSVCVFGLLVALLAWLGT